MPTLRELIADGRVHVFDGAMGTVLYARGFYLNVCYDELSLRQPKLIEEVHQAYVRAGSPGALLRGRIERMHRASLILTFGGGTNEVQRDIVAAVGLGLPPAKR